MNDLVKLILSLSLSGSILAALIFAMKPLMKNRFSKTLQYYIWLVVLLRLLLPFSFEGSLMNKVFQEERVKAQAILQTGSLPAEASGEVKLPEAEAVPVVQGNAETQAYVNPEKNIDFKELFNKYALYLWLLGAVAVLTSNLTGYFRFSKYLMKTNKPAGEDENKILEGLLKGRKNLRLMRNPHAATPLLIGMLRPCIIIPDNDFTEGQLKNILLHELTHLKRFDIGVKWLMMIAAAMHWFNPLIYLIKKEVNHACELACDEGVIKNLTNVEKQAYGDTLISVVAEHKYPVGVLQATMCEEKRTLKERLMAIMKHRKKSRFIIALSGVLIIAVATGAMFLGGGAGIAILGKNPPKLYISIEYDKTKTAVTGGYHWSYLGTHTIADTDHPINFEYKFDNIVSATSNEQLILGTQKINMDRKYEFTLEDIAVYKAGEKVEFNAEPSFINGSMYLQAPTEAGEYIYVVDLGFKSRGRVTYGFVVRVNMPTYDLGEIAKHRTPYVGDNSKVSAMVSSLPLPDRFYKQQYISLVTETKPYRLNVYYEAREGNVTSKEWPVNLSTMNSNMQKNGLVLFSMIDNLDEITFAFRDSQSEGKLEESKYESRVTFSRDLVKARFGDPTELGKNLDLLRKALKSGGSALEVPKTPLNLRDLPKDYKYDVAIKNGDVVYSGYYVYNSKKLEEFYGDYKIGSSSRVRITRYTKEGDAVIHDVIADGRGIRLIVDNTRDKFGTPGVNDFKVFDIVKEEKPGETIYKINLEGNKGSYDFHVNSKYIGDV